MDYFCKLSLELVLVALEKLSPTQPDYRKDKGESYLLPMDHSTIEDCLDKLQESLTSDVSNPSKLRAIARSDSPSTP